MIFMSLREATVKGDCIVILIGGFMGIFIFQHFLAILNQLSIHEPV